LIEFHIYTFRCSGHATIKESAFYTTMTIQLYVVVCIFFCVNEGFEGWLSRIEVFVHSLIRTHTHTHPFFHSCAPMYSCHCVHSFIHASVRWVLSSSHLWVGPRSHDFLHRQFPVRVAIDDVEEPLAHQRVEVEHRVRRLDHLPTHLFLIGGWWWWWTYGWIETGRVEK
jgi:hypothetical protein